MEFLIHIESDFFLSYLQNKENKKAVVPHFKINIVRHRVFSPEVTLSDFLYSSTTFQEFSTNYPIKFENLNNRMITTFDIFALSTCILLKFNCL